jgi:addiction module RelE/StbE family toxin
MRVHWTNRAKARLKLIYDYINAESPQAAIEVVDRITARSMQLNELPNSGRKVPEYQRNDVREVLEKPYRIIYKIKSNQIDVITVMHYRQILPVDVSQL